MNSSQLINATSSDVEYYTPRPIIEAARKSMGGVIDLDPATSVHANLRIGAVDYYIIGQNGLTQDWHGRVWMNHPFGRAEKPCPPDCQKDHVHHDYELFGNAAWIDKLVSEYRKCNVTQACCITYACTSETWFQPLLREPQCFLTPRTNYELPDGTIKKGVTKGSVVTYFGPYVNRFATAFKDLGVVKLPWNL